MVVVVAVAPPWGTWEELVLGGAILRHGTQAWEAVASELRARTLFPNGFTPEACKAQYEDLRQRYSGCTAWFEELRKRRVAELRRELEKSEDSIGSLESKLESLKADKGDYNCIDYGSNQIDSPVPLVKSEGVESSGKDTSKDGLSAGSFTEDIRTNWLSECQIQATVSGAGMVIKREISFSSEQVKLPSIKKLAETSNEQGGTPRKRRGKRKRKDCNKEFEEGSNGESENVGSTNVVTASQFKENSTGGCGLTFRSSFVNNHNSASCGVQNGYLMSIFNSVAENESALVFRRRLDGQKRARYKKTVRRHMDFDTLRSRIATGAIMSVKELFRDLFLLANNAMVFYSKRTREYKTALLLRGIVTEAYRQHCKDSTIRVASPIFPLSPLCNLPVKPRSVRPYKHKISAVPPNPGTPQSCGVRPYKHKLSATLPNAGTPQGCKRPRHIENLADGKPEKCKKLINPENVVSGTSQVWRKLSNTDSRSSMESMMTKKGFSWMGKVGRGMSNQQCKAPLKEKKRVGGRWKML